MLNLAQYYRERHQPDILDTIANLSSDEVFTPPALADKILDILPNEIWSDPNITFLDPATKSGIFLRQIAARLMVGLRDAIPDEQERREHIFKNQLYAIAITELTSYIARRSVYYSKTANGPHGVANFDTAEGNVHYVPTNHTFQGKKCVYCGQAEGEGIGARDVDGRLETHAYEFIHLTPEEASKMKFDVIVGNPPYQLDSGGFGAQATPIYHKFVEQAKLLKPRYIAFIIPSRWFAGGMGLSQFRADMLADKHIKELVDYPNASDCFPGVDIKGGVNYFVWDSEYSGDTTIRTIIGDDELPSMKRPLGEYDTFIRYNQAIPVLRKVRGKNEESVTVIASGLNPFNIPTNFRNYDKIDNPDKIKLYARGDTGYMLDTMVQANRQWRNKYKVLASKAAEGAGTYPNNIIGKPIVAEMPSVCTMTYFCAGIFDTESEAKNYALYMKSRFFRFLVSLKKNTQDFNRDKMEFVPLLPMNEEWTDEKLYARYGIDADEQAFIESMIKEMV